MSHPIQSTQAVKNTAPLRLEEQMNQAIAAFESARAGRAIERRKPSFKSSSFLTPACRTEKPMPLPTRHQDVHKVSDLLSGLKVTGGAA